MDTPTYNPGRNGGRLKRGGTNKGSGRPPSAIRQAARGDFDTRRKILCTIADDPNSTNADRIRAIDLLGKYGLGTTITETDTEGKDRPRVVEVPVKMTPGEWNRMALATTNGKHR